MSSTTTQVTPQSATSGVSLHPMNSSQLMLAMLKLVEAGRDRTPNATGIAGLVSIKVLRTLLTALQFRDGATMLHSRRTSLVCRGIAERLGWETESLCVIELAALLHDIGKIGLPDHVLLKPGRLSPDEAEHIAVQHRVAVSLLQACGVRPEVIEIIGQAHGIVTEADNLNGQFHLGARILSVADAFDSLTTKQAYRLAFERQEAMKVLQDQSGKQFDRNVVAALSRWLESPAATVLPELDGTEVESNPTHVSFDTQAETHSLCYLLSAMHSIEVLYEAFVVVDANLNVCVWNFGAEQVFQCSARNVLGKPWDARQLSIVGVSGNDGAQALINAVEKGESFCRRLIVKSSLHDDTLRELEIHAVPFFEGAAIRGAMGVIYDGKQARKNNGKFRQLQMAATRDALTGVLNRAGLEEQLSQHFEDYGTSSGKKVFSVIFLDLDHFKGINDRLGHTVGDKVLVDVARLMQDETYSGECVGRYGGEEFVIVCPEAALTDTLERAERLRRALMSAKVANRTDLRVTASFGVAQIESGDTVESLVERADAALYDAKHGGRNRTCSRRRHEHGLEVALTTKLTPAQQEWAVHMDLITNVASDLIVYKIKGFIEDNAAQLLTCTSKQLVMNCGTATLFGWGNAPAKQPVRVTIDIQEVPTTESNTRNKQLLLKTTIEPVSRPLRAVTFQERAHQLLDQLRSYCIAEFYVPKEKH